MVKDLPFYEGQRRDSGQLAPKCKKATHVNTNDRADHLGHDDHVPEMGLDHRGLLVGLCLALGLAELLDETHGAALETALEPPASTGVDKLCGVSAQIHFNLPTQRKESLAALGYTHVDESLVAQVEQLVELDTAVRVLFERSGSFLGGGLFAGGKVGLKRSVYSPYLSFVLSPHPPCFLVHNIHPPIQISPPA